MKLNIFSFSKLLFVRRISWQQGSENKSNQVGTIHPRSVVDLPGSVPKVWELAGQKMGKILVVAADFTEREGLALAIELTGHNCATAASLRVAVSLLGKGSFDLVVTDWKIEGSDPGQSVESLKKACPGVLVMILSHRRIEESIPGADYFAVIPCSPKKLQDSLRQALSKKSSRRPPGKVAVGTKSPAVEGRKFAAGAGYFRL